MCVRRCCFLLATASARNAVWKRPKLSVTAQRQMMSMTANEKEPELKFCINCVHCMPKIAGTFFSYKLYEFAKCRANPKMPEFLVAADPEKLNYCSIARNDDRMCGEKGSKFQAKFFFVRKILVRLGR